MISYRYAPTVGQAATLVRKRASGGGKSSLDGAPIVQLLAVLDPCSFYMLPGLLPIQVPSRVGR